MNPSETFTEGTTWKGIFIYSKTKEMVPFSLRIVVRDKDKFDGEIAWPSIDEARTKCEGELTETSITFSEVMPLMRAEKLEFFPLQFSGTGKLNVVEGKAKNPEGIETAFR